MKIVIDGRMLYATGIGRYLRHLLEELASLDNHNQYVVLLRPQDRGRWAPKTANFTAMEVDAPIYSLAEQTVLGRTLRELKPDLVHFPSFNSPVFFGGKRITTIHDLTMLDYSVARGNLLRRTVYRLKHAVMHYQIRQILRRSQAVLTDTEFVRQQLSGRGLVPAKRITTTWLGVPLAGHAKAEPLAIEAPFLLYVGNFYPFKNLVRLVEALPRLTQDNPQLKLVLVGQKDEFEAGLEALARRLGVADHVIFTGFVPDSQLVWLYQNASLFVFPSLSEGFGLPGLEAMQYGLPVAAANASCLPEVYGDAAVYFDPNDTADMARVISETLADKERLAELKARGLGRVKQFSWRRMAEQTLEVYKSVLGE